MPSRLTLNKGSPLDISDLIDGLNEHQREAVASEQGNMLVLAGAGSGKTKVLVHRIAWLLKVEQLSPFSILSVTFTNKAASEMRSRVENLLGGQHGGIWLGTFHGIAHRLLRSHYNEVGLPEAFQIIDSDDQYRMIRRILKSFNLDEKQHPPKQIQWYINNKKDEGLRAQHIDTQGNPVEHVMKQVYQAYQEACDRAGLVDFAELLLRAHELWLQSPHILAHYQQRFSHILVDEFQDTNTIQYAWLTMLAGEQCYLTIVGDDDQSIYGWRGAKVENIQRFLKQSDNVKTVRLEQNYRSTGSILKAANALISNNSDRLGKELWTQGNDGEAISVYSAFNEVDEARFVVSEIRQHFNAGTSFNDCAILYRSNAQSRVLEEALMQDAMPYRIYGGQRFFDRQEVKDALAYLRLIFNRQDDAAFERIVNTPTRGMGDKTLNSLRQHAREAGASLWESTTSLLKQGVLKGRAASAASNFIDLIIQLEHNTLECSLDKQTDHVIKASGLLSMYRAEKGGKAQDREDNLKELVNATAQFKLAEEHEDMSPLAAFLSHAALESGDTQADEGQDAVQLMTLHSAKGLEFPYVFMVGVEEGMFPSQRSSSESGRLEEERRLCYVGITRAMQKLTISHAESRRLYGQEQFNRPSRFIKELPDEYLQEVRLKTKVIQPRQQQSRFGNAALKQSFDDTGLRLGQLVKHPKFGEGIVLNFEGSGEHARVQVQFSAGPKWLVVAYAKLEKI